MTFLNINIYVIPFILLFGMGGYYIFGMIHMYDMPRSLERERERELLGERAPRRGALSW